MTVDYFRCSPTLSLQTAPDGTQTLILGDTPLDASPLQLIIVDILLRYPDASLDELRVAISARQSHPVSLSNLANALETLGQLGVVALHKSTPRISMPYPLRHSCEMCGCSCLAQLVGPLSDAEHDDVLDAHSKLPDVPKDVNPIMKGIRPDGSCLHFLNFPGKRCFFLDDHNRCRIHAEFGPMKKPAACRRFPLIAIRTESEIRLGIKPYCYAGMRACDLTPAAPGLLEQYRADSRIAPILDDLIESASFRPVLRINDDEELLQAHIQETQILTWLQSDLSYPALLTSLARGTLSDSASLPRAFIQDAQNVLRQFAPLLRSEIKKLGTTAHAAHAESLCALLEKPLTSFDALSPTAPFGKYLRYAIYKAVFLRETSRFPAVSLGTFALALGALPAAQDPDNAGTHITAWFRLFAQTQAFALLFPTPQAMSALMRHL